ncbi:prolyl-tRNA synthetase associated domain-containing protein [Acidaminococcus sp. AM05-11]|jgi:Ala-tRNA(Pro) deacylase|uniref:prolyl-tRNA synthetase associated domain-containing protein n=1 Tax=Acidaminococcus TaxID=904 RepID=UPI000E4A6B6D|nr:MULTISPECIES: prolyl-tRNA synthetase associated domain-containing protein [Acidaminococcus]RHJ97749.1 prolyl-tRNA synthetase associated domain-containing protein [Acidaminococcus sp. AM05-11]
MDKKETLAYLTAQGIPYELTEHKAVYNMEELGDVALPYPEWDAKNLFVRDDKKRNYYLLTVRGNKRVDLKAFGQANGTRRLSFASPEDLKTYLELEPGSVTPLGLLNDREHRVTLFLDAEFQHQKIGVHPNDNTATLWLAADALMALLEKLGKQVHWVKIGE